MTDPVPLHELLANYEPAPAKHGALIRAAVRLADYVLDVTTRLVIDLEPGEIDDGSLLYGFICDATNVGGRKPPPPDVISQTIPLDEIPTRSESTGSPRLPGHSPTPSDPKSPGTRRSRQSPSSNRSSRSAASR